MDHEVEARSSHNPLDAALGAPQPQPEVAPETPPEPQVPVEVAAQPAPEPDAGEPPTLQAGHVPIAAMLDEREKRQAAERRARELEDWKRQQEEAFAQPLPTDQILAAQRYQDNLRYSRKFAERQYGKELIDQVHQWAYDRAERDPYFNAEMAAHDDPYEAAVLAYNREQVLQAVSPADLEAFRAWKAAQAAAQGAPTPQPGAPAGLTAPKPPPVSLANASGTGALGAAAIPAGEGEAYASLFRPPSR